MLVGAIFSLLSISVCHGSPHSTMKLLEFHQSPKRVFLDLRGGGSSPSWRQPAPTGNNRLQKTGQQSVPSSFQVQQEEEEPEKTAEQTKDMIDAFLTRESRNSFIGKQQNVFLKAWKKD